MRTFLLAVVLLAFPASAGTQELKGTFFPYPMKVTRLPNGLVVTRVPFNSPGLVAYYTVVRVGSRNEVEKGNTGFAHFFEHVMFKGTKKWPAGSRDALLGKLGFSENAFTSDDVTVYHVSGPSSELGRVVEVEADRFANLEYGEETFQTEAKAVLGEYHKNAANPGLKIEEEILNTAFDTHTYKHTTLGFYEDIQAMPSKYEYSKSFFKRWYTPDNTMVFVVGDFDDAALMKSVEENYGGWKGKVASVEIPVEPPQKLAKYTTVTWTTPTLPRLGMCWKSPRASLTSGEHAAAEMLQSYLAGQTSPLYKKLVLEAQLVESLHPDYSGHRDPNLFCIFATLKNESSRETVRTAMQSAVDSVMRGAVDARRLAAISENLKYGFQMGLETHDAVALELAYSAGVLGAPDALEQVKKALSKVGPRDLISFARTYLVPRHLTSMDFVVKLPATDGGRP